MLKIINKLHVWLYNKSMLIKILIYGAILSLLVIPSTVLSIHLGLAIGLPEGIYMTITFITFITTLFGTIALLVLGSKYKKK